MDSFKTPRKLDPSDYVLLLILREERPSYHPARPTRLSRGYASCAD
jgi:hypothetical protein